MSMLRVSEIFGPTIQGEGAQIGRPTVFVRLGGCDYRCSWCDSLYAVIPNPKAPWTRMTQSEVLDKVHELVPHGEVLITLSGGNPALQNACADLIDLGHAHGHTFTMETQGSIARPWFAQLDHLCISPKPPSSGMETDWDKLAFLLEQRGLSRPDDTILKVVVFDRLDFAYASEVRKLAWKFNVPLYLQVGNMDVGTMGSRSADHRLRLMESMTWLAEQCLREGWYDVRVLPQLHVLMFGNQRGV